MKEIKENWEKLNADIIKIRESWAEDSEYCQDEIMDRFYEYLAQQEKEILEKIEKDKHTAKRCLNWKGFDCSNKDCLNESCPLKQKLKKV